MPPGPTIAAFKMHSKRSTQCVCWIFTSTKAASVLVLVSFSSTPCLSKRVCLLPSWLMTDRPQSFYLFWLSTLVSVATNRKTTILWSSMHTSDVVAVQRAEELAHTVSGEVVAEKTLQTSGMGTATAEAFCREDQLSSPGSHPPSRRGRRCYHLHRPMDQQHPRHQRVVADQKWSSFWETQHPIRQADQAVYVRIRGHPWPMHLQCNTKTPQVASAHCKHRGARQQICLHCTAATTAESRLLHSMAR